jgi:hypothetical protein
MLPKERKKAMEGNIEGSYVTEEEKKSHGR